MAAVLLVQPYQLSRTIFQLQSLKQTVCLHSVVDSRHICLLLLLKTVVNCNVASASVSLHTFSFMALYKFVFTRESSYAIARLSYRNSVRPSIRLSVCPSVRPSVTRVDQAKTVQARISKSSPSAAWKTLVSGTVKLFRKLEGGHPERGR